MSRSPSGLEDEARSSAQLTDFADATLALQRYFHPTSPRGYVLGKTEIRNALEELFGLSAVAAETTVEELESRGFIRYSGDPREVDTGERVWLLRPTPDSVA